jgi:hypothetical protein
MENTQIIRKLALSIANANAAVERLLMEISNEENIIASKNNSIDAIYLWTGQYSKAIKHSRFYNNISPCYK